MKFEDWTENIKEGTEIYLVCVKVDLAGGTELWKCLDRDEVERRKNFYRQKAEDVFLRFGAVRTEWHGDGCNFFFGNQETIEENAIKSSIELLTQLKIGIEGEIPVRISINSGITKYKRELGKMDNAFLDFCGHLNSACPENSILITENIYFALSKELKEKFALCGTTERDKVVAFIFPKEKKNKKSYEYFLSENDDNALVYITYLKSLEGQCKTLAFSGIRQMRKMPLLELTEAFFPLKLRVFANTFEEREFFIEKIDDKNVRREKIVRKPILDLTPTDFLDIYKKEKRHLVIVGDPGSGKTTLLKWLCLLYSRGLKSVTKAELDDNALFPILVPISAVYLEIQNQEHISPVDAISRYYESLGIKNLNGLLEDKLEKGNCIVLLDGLDEIPESKDRFSTARYIENFIRRFEKNRFIITSRILGYEEIGLPSIKEYTLCPLEEKDIEKFIHNWFTSFEKELSGDSPITKTKVNSETKQLWDSVNQDERIKDLASNPFLLTLICIIQRAGQTLPRYRVELYRLCAETLFETWLEARSISGKTLAKTIDFKEGEKVLAPLSLWMLENFPGGIAKQDVIEDKIIKIMEERGISKEEAVQSTNEFFKYLSEQTQLIIPKGGDYYGFRHLTFEEFLSARALIMNKSYPKYFKKYSYNPKWTEVLLLTAGWLGIIDGIEIEVTKIVENLLKRDDDLEKILHKNLLLAGKIISEDLGIKKDVAEKVVEKIYNIYNETDFEELGEEAKDTLSMILLKEEGKKIYQKLISTLVNKKEDKWVRRKAANALVSVVKENEEVLNLLITTFKDKKEDESVRLISANALVSVVKENKEILDLLITILKDKKEDRLMRGSSAYTLGSVVKENKEALDLLITILEDKKEDELVRQSSAYALSPVIEENEEVLNLLITILKDKKEDESVRQRSAYALGSVIKENEEVLNLLIAILKDEEEHILVRRTSVFVLGNADKEDREVVSLLLNQINNETFCLIPSLCSILELGVYNKKHINLALNILKNKMEIERGNLLTALWSIYS